MTVFLLIVFLLLVLFGLILDIWMLIDVAKRQVPNKARWIFTLVFVPWAGSIFYYFAVRSRNYGLKPAQTPTDQHAQQQSLQNTLHNIHSNQILNVDVADPHSRSSMPHPLSNNTNAQSNKHAFALFGWLSLGLVVGLLLKQLSTGLFVGFMLGCLNIIMLARKNKR